MTYLIYGLRTLFWLALAAAIGPVVYHFLIFMLAVLALFFDHASVPWKLFVYGIACAGLISAILAVLERYDANRSD